MEEIVYASLNCIWIYATLFIYKEDDKNEHPV